ncbi:MAG TPA: YeeE/YedE thiosulfate transporter family protein [Thermoanaerobaculia bacterium]|nr:YeeE/YedE thiosulfate transporter family protein [Thermoanaerobaculia bacterium]
MKSYADPYIAGAGLGLVLLASFVLTGRGLGASGAFGEAIAFFTRDGFFARYASDHWLLFELAGVLTGGFLSALFAKRLTLRVERGPAVSTRSRLAIAFAGGTIMGIGAVLARGCTSGLALTGGALLAVGSWVFLLAAFAAAYLAAPLARRIWR